MIEMELQIIVECYTVNSYIYVYSLLFLEHI